ncbi:MAG: hypothetical protein ACHQQR_16065 [Gemmatimonadales bacterium]
MTGPPSDPPAGIREQALSRAALERVLARAAQLQAAIGDGDEPGSMTEAQLVELGKEVGLSGELLRQALAEERGRTLLPAESGWLASLTGVSAVTAARTVTGKPATVLAALDAWMQRGEALQVKRRFADQLVWEARRDIFAVIRRTLPIWGRGLELGPANEVSAIVAPVGPEKTHARIVADFSVTRSRRATTGAALACAMLLITAPLVVIHVPPLLAAIPAALAALLTMLVTRRQYRQLVSRAQVSLEQALDRLEFADAKPATTAQALLDAFIGPPRPPK